MDAFCKLADYFLDTPLVPGIAKAVQQTNCNRIYAGVEEALHFGAGLFFVEHALHCSIRKHPLGDRSAKIARNEGQRLLDTEIVKIEAMLGTDFDGVPKALGCQECRWSTPPHDHGIRDERRAMHDPLHVLGNEITRRNHFGQAALDGCGRIGVIGEDFTG